MMENKTKIDLKNKSIFITGVAGFIGSNLAKRLLSTVEGVKVVGLDNMNHYYDVRLKEARLNELEQFENFSFVKGNLADKAVIESIFEQYKPEIVVNLGAQAGVRYSITNPDAYVEANLIGFYLSYAVRGNGNEDMCEPKISFRNGKYYVVDGQHTIEARILRNGGRALPILCKVYTGMTMQQEALLFAEQNGHSAPLSAGIKLRAKVAGDDAPSKEFLAATNRVGLAFNYDSLQLSDYRISCVGTALKLYNEMGEKIYCASLRLIVAAWDGKPDSFRASVLRGMMHFVELYHGEFSEERLVRALGSVHPMEIYRVGRDNPAKLPGWKKYVFPIYMAYNGKGRKDALPMKF